MELIKRKRFLVVDNEIDNLNAIKCFMEKRDFEVITTSNYEDALNQINSNKFDIALIDLHFNGENSGLGLIKNTPNNEKPLMIMSTNETVNILKQAINLGVYYWFDKPLDLAFLFEKVREFSFLILPEKVPAALSIINEKRG